MFAVTVMIPLLTISQGASMIKYQPILFKLPGDKELLPKGIITKLFKPTFRNGREN
jgi:hypothetical protein